MAGEKLVKVAIEEMHKGAQHALTEDKFRGHFFRKGANAVFNTVEANAKVVGKKGPDLLKALSIDLEDFASIVVAPNSLQ